jgi:hypothetical protein
MKRLSSILAIGTASLFSTTAAAMDNDATVSLAAWEQPLNNIAQVACHNCYEPQYSPNGRAFSAVLDYVKTVEIDFWDQRDMASEAAAHQPSAGSCGTTAPRNARPATKTAALVTRRARTTCAPV